MGTGVGVEELIFPVHGSSVDLLLNFEEEAVASGAC
jgi:hypothetical protein